MNNRKFGTDRKTLIFILGVVIVSIFTLTIAYAALSVTLNIVGSAKVVASEWDIYLDNVSFTEGSDTTYTPTIEGTSIDFKTVLNMPGDFYEFTVDIVNAGTIDAMIDAISLSPVLTAEQMKYLKYEITYQNGQSVLEKHLVASNSFVKLKVRIEYRSDVLPEDLPTSQVVLDLSCDVNYTQSDDTAVAVPNNGTSSLIFYIDTKPYYYDAGMTWRTWMDSSYNTTHVTYNNHNDIQIDGFCLSFNRGGFIDLDDYIESVSYESSPCVY